jgi:hypothetical protein
MRLSFLDACAIVLLYGATYLLVTWRLGFPEVAQFLTRALRLGRRRAN